MKRQKSVYLPWWLGIVSIIWFFSLLLDITLAALTVGCVYYWLQGDQTFLRAIIYCILMDAVLPAGMVYVHYEFSRYGAWAKIKGPRIEWHYPLCFPVRMTADQCRYVGIGDLAAVNQGYLWGDAIAFIYLSETPLEPRLQHRIFDRKVKRGFIRFSYSKALCDRLISILPEAQAQTLRVQQAMLQAYQTPREIKRKNKPKNKKKKK